MRNSISRFMTIAILSISLLVAVCSAIYEIRADYSVEMHAVESSLNLIESTHVPAMAAAVWSLDPVQINKQITGIANLPDISYVSIRGKFPFEIDSRGKSIKVDEKTQDWPVVQRKYDLVYADKSNGGTADILGQLEVEASLQGLHARLQARAARIFFTEIVRSLILAAVIILSVRLLLVRHLAQIADYTSKLTIDRLDAELRLVHRQRQCGDELDELVGSINAMRISLRDEVKKRHEIEHANHVLATEKEAVELASAAKRDFFAQISHEIRTPMNAIIGMSHLLLHGDMPDDARHYVRKIRQAALLLLGVIDDILDMSKFDAGQMQIDSAAFNIHEFAEDVIDVIEQSAADKGLQFNVKISADLPERVIGDALRLRQIAINLLSNAVKFTSHGHVVFGIKLLQRDDSRLTLRIWVEDSGIGLSAEQIERIFTPYAQADRTIARRYGGTGLGLSLSQRIAALMSSRIIVESREGEGSTFFLDVVVDLPDLNQTQGREIALATSSKEAVEASARDAERLVNGALSGTRWLVVEDNLVNQEITRALLALVGAQVVIAGSGEDALAILETQIFDGVLMDEMLPGIGGLETTIKIRERPKLKSLPVIGMSASISTDDQQRAIEVGMSDSVAKPVNPRALYVTLAKWVGYAAS